MAEGQIKTTIDALLELVRSKGKIDVNNIAMQLGMSTAIVENWVRILEKGGLVKVTYEIGRMYVQPVASSEAKVLEGKLNAQAEVLGTEFDSKLLELAQLSDMVDSLKASVIVANKAYAEKFPDLQQRLGEINKIYDQMNKENASALDMKGSLERVYESTTKKVSGLIERMNFIESKGINTLPEEVRKEQDTLDKASNQGRMMQALHADVETWARETMKQFDAEAVRMRASLLKQSLDIKQQLAAITKELAATNASLGGRLKDARTLIAQVEGFNREKNREMAALDRAVKAFSERYSKSYDAVTRGIALLNGKSGELIGGIEAVKAGFGDVARVDDMLHDIQSGVAKSEKSVKELREEIISLRTEMAKLEGKPVTLQARTDGLKAVAQKASVTEGRISEVRKDIKGVLERIKVKEIRAPEKDEGKADAPAGKKEEKPKDE